MGLPVYGITTLFSKIENVPPFRRNFLALDSQLDDGKSMYVTLYPICGISFGDGVIPAISNGKSVLFWILFLKRLGCVFF